MSYGYVAFLVAFWYDGYLDYDLEIPIILLRDIGLGDILRLGRKDFGGWQVVERLISSYVHT